jgi:hypothetical protein
MMAVWQGVWTWVHPRPRGVTLALCAAVGLVVLPSAGFGLPLAALAAQDPQLPAHAMPKFEHRRHGPVECLTCHVAHAATRLNFVPPSGCQNCHHRSPEENRCPSCHTPDVLAAPRAVIVTVRVRGRPPRSRTVNFRHTLHATRPCSGCHTQETTLAPGDSVRTCTACHDDHHQAARACDGCHTERAAFAPHAPPAEAHAGCDACHATRTIARLVPDRALCLTCHAARRDHGLAKECTTCHFQEDPASYRSRLVSGRTDH